MSDENTALVGGGEALPASDTKPAPKNDAEAAQQDSAQQPDEAERAEAERKAAEAKETEAKAEEKKRNRTRDYINRINAENAELRRRVAEREAAEQQHRQPQQQAHAGPTLEEYGYDMNAWQQAHAQWVLQQARSQWTQEQQQAETTRREQEAVSGFQMRAAEFADEHPDFLEVVGSIPYELSEPILLAIAGHPKGPEIAYHLGNNDEDAFALASIQPHLAAAAVHRIASRLDVAQTTPAAPALVVTPTPKPITAAPPPPPMVGGRSPVETPPEKLTDDQWFAREKERRRKR